MAVNTGTKELAVIEQHNSALHLQSVSRQELRELVCLQLQVLLEQENFEGAKQVLDFC